MLVHAGSLSAGLLCVSKRGAPIATVVKTLNPAMAALARAGRAPVSSAVCVQLSSSGDLCLQHLCDSGGAAYLRI